MWFLKYVALKISSNVLVSLVKQTIYVNSESNAAKNNRLSMRETK